MDFMDNLGKRLGEVVKTVEEKSSELLSIGKLNIEIIKEKDAIRRLYHKIGELIYEAYDKNGDYSGAADAHCIEIKERKDRIDELNIKIEEIRKARHEESKPADDDDNIVDQMPDDIDITDADTEAYSTSASDEDSDICPFCGHPKEQ